MLQVKLLLFETSNWVCACECVWKKTTTAKKWTRRTNQQRPHLLNKYFNKIQNANLLYLYTNTNISTRHKLTHTHTTIRKLDFIWYELLSTQLLMLLKHHCKTRRFFNKATYNQSNNEHAWSASIAITITIQYMNDDRRKNHEKWRKKKQNESNGRTYGYNNNSNNHNKSVRTYNTFHFACKILLE